MKASEKARELVEKYWDCIVYNCIPINWEQKINGKENLLLSKAKSLALICMHEILNLSANSNFAECEAMTVILEIEKL